MTIKISENFFSLQGEGLYVGVPSIFLRTFGCNFTCSGFSMPRGEKSVERLSIDPSKYTKFDDLPLVHTGCDSYGSWDPRFKHLSNEYSIDEIQQKIELLLPNKTFSQNVHFIITGGEPLLPRWQLQYIELLSKLVSLNNLSYLTFETNGTRILKPELKKYLNSSNLEITFSISAKLPCSGESWDKSIKPEVISDYLQIKSKTSYFKFVISDQQDVADVEKAVLQYKQSGIDLPVYLMPAGGTTVFYNGTKVTVSDICKQKGYRYTPRLQIDLYGNQWGT